MTTKDHPKITELRNQIQAAFSADGAGATDNELRAKIPEKILNTNIQIVNEERVHVKKALEKTELTDETRKAGERYLQLLGDYVHLLRQSLKFLKNSDVSAIEAQHTQAQELSAELQQLLTSPLLKDVISGRLPS